MDAWKKNRLTIAAFALVLLIGGLVWMMQEREKSDAPADDLERLAELLPSLEEDDVDEIEIQRPDEEAIILRKVNDEWRVVAPVEAVADKTSVDTAVEKITSLAVARVAATNADNHERLEVTDETGIRVVARKGGEDQLAFVVGAYSSGQTMVRVEDEDRVLAVEDSIKFAFNRELDRWRNRRILDEQAAQIVQASFTHGDKTFRFERGENDEWAQAADERAIERFSAAKVQSVVSSLASMSATSFGAADLDPEEAGLSEPAATVVLSVRQSSSDDDSDDAEDGEGASSDNEGTLETISLRASETGPEANQHYVQRSGDETVYVVSSFHGERLLVDVESFQDPEPGEESAAPPPPAPPMGAGASPSAMLSPEQLQEIQRQIAAQTGM